MTAVGLAALPLLLLAAAPIALEREGALGQLAAGADPVEVAAAAGCPDLETFERWLFDGGDDFLMITAGDGVPAVRHAGLLPTPLAAEVRGLRARPYWLAFALPSLRDLLGGPAGFGTAPDPAPPGGGFAAVRRLPPLAPFDVRLAVEGRPVPPREPARPGAGTPARPRERWPAETGRPDSPRRVER